MSALHGAPAMYISEMRLTLPECLLVVAAAVLAAGCGRTSGSSEAADAARDPRTAELAAQVHDLGWIVFGARTEKGDWDLFVMRPDGSERRNITNTADYNEAAPRFSPDGRKLLYRRLKKDKNIDGNRYGAQGEPVIADSDGSNRQVPGRRRRVSVGVVGPDGAQIACLAPKGISFVDLATRQRRCTLDRRGIFQQLNRSRTGSGWPAWPMSARCGPLSA